MWRWRFSSLALVGALAVIGAGCGGGDDSSSTTTTEAASDQSKSSATDEVDGSDSVELEKFDDAPAMIAAAEARVAPTDSPTRPGDAPYFAAWSGPRLPLAYMADPSADTVVSLGPTERDAESNVSPDGTAIATYVAADALEGDRYDIVATDTGKVVESIELTAGDSAGIRGELIWSPDSRAVLLSVGSGRILHRIGGAEVSQDVTSSSGLIAFASNDTTTELVACGETLTRLVVTDEPGAGQVVQTPANCQQIAQVYGTGGDPIAVYSSGWEMFSVQPGQDPASVFSAPAPSQDSVSMLIRGCGAIVTMTLEDNGGSEDQLKFHQVESGTTTAVPDWFAGSCPLLSADGTKAAYKTQQETVQVADLTAGSTVEVAKAGEPYAFGADGTKLLVQGGGTFIVGTDGSGGEKASVQIDEAGGRRWAFCRAGDTGKGLIFADDKVQLLDIDQDEAQPTEGLQLVEGCSTSQDEQWIVAGNLLVDLDSAASVVLPDIEIPSGDRVTEDSLAPGQAGDYSWFGPQVAVAGRAVTP